MRTGLVKMQFTYNTSQFCEPRSLYCVSIAIKNHTVILVFYILRSIESVMELREARESQQVFRARLFKTNDVIS